MADILERFWACIASLLEILVTGSCFPFILGPENPLENQRFLNVFPGPWQFVNYSDRDGRDDRANRHDRDDR